MIVDSNEAKTSIMFTSLVHWSYLLASVRDINQTETSCFLWIHSVD